jgi:RimJ/RimL family protein N-acetyltransferase
MKTSKISHQPESIIPVEPGLELREIAVDEATVIFRLISKDRQYLEQWFPEFKEVQKPADYAANMRRLQTRRDSGEQCGYGIVSRQRVIGHISLQDMLEEDPEMCYWVTKDESGKGIATKAVRTLTAYALETLGLPRIGLKIDHRNDASNSVAHKAGYTVRGYSYDKIHTYNLWSVYPWELARPEQPGAMGY